MYVTVNNRIGFDFVVMVLAVARRSMLLVNDFLLLFFQFFEAFKFVVMATVTIARTVLKFLNQSLDLT